MNKQLLSTPNRKIIGLGTIAAATFFSIANLLNGIWSSLFVNLAAGVATVVLTVILVDMLRTSHLEKLYSVPRATALTQITGANFSLFLTLTIKHFQTPETIQEFLDAADQVSANDTDPMNKLLNKYLHKLAALRTNELLNGYSRKQLLALKEIIVKAASSLERIRQRYEYSFSDIEFKGDVVALISKLEAATSVFSLAEFGGGILNTLITSADKEQLGLQGDEGFEVFAGAFLLDYIKTYTAFRVKYYK